MIQLPSIYAAAKIWHAPKFQQLRDAYDFDIVSRWIDYGENDPIVQQKDVLWQHCLEDVLKADIMVIYCEDMAEEMRGVIMEAGHAMAVGHRIYCINTCDSFSPSPISDVAFTHHPLWNFIRDENRLIDPLEGFSVAVSEEMGVATAEANVIPGPWSKLL